MRTAILTDSNSGIAVETGKELNIFILPMPVIIDGKSYYEGVNFTREDLYESIRENRDVSSSQPSPGDMMDMWDDILAQGYEEIVYIPMSSGLSGTYSTAAQMALDYEGRVQVVDNHRIAITLEQSVLDARHLARKGYSAKQIKEELERTAYDSVIYVAVDTLDRLKKGGRITPVVAALGSALNIKPVLIVEGERLDAYTKGRGMKQCEKKMIEAIQNDLKIRFKGYPAGKINISTVGTVTDAEQAELWRKSVEDAFPGTAVTYSSVSCSIASHVGTGALGIGICGILREV